MGGQKAFNFLRIDIHSAGYDHEVLAIGQIQITFFIDPADITERRPVGMFRIVNRRGFDRIVVVRDAVAAAEIDRADLARGQFISVIVADVDRPDHRAPHRTNMAQPLLAVDDDVAVAFRSRIEFFDDRAEPVYHRALDRDRAGRCSVDHGLERGQIVARADFVG